MILGCDISIRMATSSSVSSSAIPSVEKGFSAHLMTRSLTIFGHNRVMLAKQGYELRTPLRLANQKAGNLIIIIIMTV